MGTIYTASKTRHARLWRDLRDAGCPVVATWIDEAGPGETANHADLADRCIREAAGADCTILYVEPGDVLKGALVEAGAALAAGKRVRQVGESPSLVFAFSRHRNWSVHGSVREALAAEGLSDAR